MGERNSPVVWRAPMVIINIAAAHDISNHVVACEGWDGLFKQDASRGLSDLDEINAHYVKNEAVK